MNNVLSLFAICCGMVIADMIRPSPTVLVLLAAVFGTLLALWASHIIKTWWRNG